MRILVVLKHLKLGFVGLAVVVAFLAAGNSANAWIHPTGEGVVTRITKGAGFITRMDDNSGDIYVFRIPADLRYPPNGPPAVDDVVCFERLNEHARKVTNVEPCPVTWP